MKYLNIFLGNKLISCDTVLPFALDIKKQYPDTRIIFYAFQNKTIETIKKNITLNNLIHENGKLLLFGYYDRPYIKIARVFGKIINIVLIILTSLIHKTNNIHFRSLEFFPFNIIYFFNRKGTFLFENNCWGYSELTYKADLLFYVGRVGTEQTLFKSFDKLVSFSKEWPQYQLNINNNKKLFFIKPTRSSALWLNESKNQATALESNSPDWLKHVKINKNAILYILGSMNIIPTLNKNSSGNILLSKTIDFLIKNTKSIILLKPHAITDMKIVNNIISKYDSRRIYVVYNHVSVLSHFCSITISNYFSYAMADAWMNNSKVIEFSHYDDEVLKLTNNKSIVSKYVDIFINNDLKKLDYEFSKPLERPKRLTEYNEKDDTNLLISSFFER